MCNDCRENAPEICEYHLIDYCRSCDDCPGCEYERGEAW